MMRILCLTLVLCVPAFHTAAAQSKSKVQKGSTNRVLMRDYEKTLARLDQMQADYVAMQNAVRYLNLLLQNGSPPLKLLTPGFDDFSQMNPRDPAERIKIELRLSELSGDLAQLERQVKIVSDRVAKMKKTLKIEDPVPPTKAGTEKSGGS
jgi:hypothetical protein